MANATAYFALQARDMWHCVPHHPLWVFAGINAATVILSYAIQYQAVGLGVSTRLYEKLSRKEFGDTIAVDDAGMRARVLLTLSETWATPEAKFIVAAAMFALALNSGICFVHPHIAGLVLVSACATLAVAVSHWASMQHRVASIFLAIINTAFQMVVSVRILRFQYELWYVLLAVQIAFMAVFVIFVLFAWHFKVVSDAPVRASKLEYDPLASAGGAPPAPHCIEHVNTEFALYSCLLPVVELGNLATFFVTMFLVFDPQYV